MSESMFSPLWYRVARLQPQLRSHIEIHRHHYRDKLWYVLEDHSTGRHHRFKAAAFYIIAQLDGNKNMQEIWDMAVNHLGDDAPTQDEMIRLFSQLHSIDALLCDVPPDTIELFQRYQTHERFKWKQRLYSPLSLRFPLFDPEQFLDRWEFLVRFLFSWIGVVLWLSVVGSAAILAGIHWTELTQNISDRVLTPYNLLMLFLMYPVIKLLHEFGHAFATKVWGGEVHEMGIMLLVFMPIPYVEASSASSFRNKYKRMIVGAAGMLIELFLAAIAMYVWLSVEPGLVHAIAYNTMLIGSVSTLFFNGNPLLRFDGYYVLADAIEIPNLSSRSLNYIGYLIQRYIFGVRETKSPASSSGERVWFLLYGIASFCYRLFIVAFIIVFVASKFFIIGVIMAIWALVTMIFAPVFKKISFLLYSPLIKRHRLRAVFTSTSTVLCILIYIILVPLPLSTRAEGVIWVPDNALVRAGANGFYQSLLVTANSEVKQGQPLIVTEDPFLPAEKKILEYRLKELEANYYLVQEQDRTQALIIKEELSTVESELERAQEKESELIIRSPTHGTLIVPQETDLPDRFLHKGELVAYVVEYPLKTVRVVVPQNDIGLVRNQTRYVEVKFVDNLEQTIPASIQREVPAASYNLPSAALGYAGGGVVPIDPTDSEGSKSFESVFQFDLKLPETSHARYLGQRVYVRFDHGKEPLAYQWYRVIRQLLIRKFSI